MLLEAKANVESTDQDGFTPLTVAAYNGHPEVVKLLLEAKANVESKNRDGWTPLAAAASNGHSEVVKLLLEAKANFESKDRSGWTPLNWAASSCHIDVVKLLLEVNTKVILIATRLMNVGMFVGLRKTPKDSLSFYDSGHICQHTIFAGFVSVLICESKLETTIERK